MDLSAYCGFSLSPGLVGLCSILLSPVVRVGENSVARRTPSGSIERLYFKRLDLVVINEGFSEDDTESNIERYHSLD